MTNKLESITFFNGHKMPIFGLGAMRSHPGETGRAVDIALEIGYRHIDTAFVYQTEGEIGPVLKKWLASGKVKREELFIVTKLPAFANRAADVEKYMKKSLAALQLDYVDLYLIHHPVGYQNVNSEMLLDKNYGNNILDMDTDHISLWKAMEDQVDAGHTLSIGLSNFNARQIKRIWQAARIKPANLQVELHVYFQQRELRAFCQALDVTICAYGVLGSPYLHGIAESLGQDVSRIPKQDPLTDPVITKVAQKYGKTIAQVLFRYIMQLGVAVIPKSSNPERIRQNFDVFDFELSTEDMEALESLDKGPCGRKFNDSVMHGTTAHPENPLNDRY